jgi:hypothetical protein
MRKGLQTNQTKLVILRIVFCDGSFSDFAVAFKY